MPNIEEWKPIEEFPDYRISSDGRVYNQRTDTTMSLNRTLQGDLKVSMTHDGYRGTRSVRVLVAEAFVHNPHPTEDEFSAAYNTVIVLDGNKDHVWASNLAWRPAWFAIKYAMQFDGQYDKRFYTKFVRNNNTGQEYRNLFVCAMREGLLIEDVFHSILVGAHVFPSNCTYSWHSV